MLITFRSTTHFNQKYRVNASLVKAICHQIALITTTLIITTVIIVYQVDFSILTEMDMFKMFLIISILALVMR